MTMHYADDNAFFRDDDAMPGIAMSDSIYYRIPVIPEFRLAT
jgi:hypothetical protein